MKKNVVKKVMGMIPVMMISAALLAGCGQAENQDTGSTGQSVADPGSAEVSSNSEMDTAAGVQTESGVSQLEVRFGDEGEPFMMQLEDNETAAAIARHVGTADWRLPIYERDDDADYGVMQYYDISSRYEIPSNPENVTLAKVGDVYYSDPSRIVLFYHDAEISEEYTRIGSFDATNEFVAAVEGNPVLEGWENKIIQIIRP